MGHSILDVMSEVGLRDSIMAWMTPKEALHLRLTCRGMLPPEDMPMYTSVFKYVITDRVWMLRQMREGYNFTIISPLLTAMMDMSFATIPWHAHDITRKPPPSPINGVGWGEGNQRVMWIILIATKNGRFVPLTEEIAPTSKFVYPGSTWAGGKRDYGNWMSQPGHRRIVSSGPHHHINLCLPQRSSALSVPYFLSWNTYYNSLSIDGEDARNCQYVNQYAHASADRVVIKSMRRSKAAPRPEDLSTTLLTLRTTPDHCKTSRDVFYSIPDLEPAEKGGADQDSIAQAEEEDRLCFAFKRLVSKADSGVMQLQ